MTELVFPVAAPQARRAGFARVVRVELLKLRHHVGFVRIRRLNRAQAGTMCERLHALEPDVFVAAVLVRDNEAHVDARGEQYRQTTHADIVIRENHRAGAHRTGSLVRAPAASMTLWTT